MKHLLLSILILGGCATHTARIAASANDARAEVDAARVNLEQAMGSLDRIEHAAAEVHAQIGYVSDDASPVVEALKYGSYIAGALAVCAVVYLIRSKT